MRHFALLLLCNLVAACNAPSNPVNDFEPPGEGPYDVASTNIEVAPAYAGIGDEAMHGFLLGAADDAGNARYVADILAHPASAWIVDVRVPDDVTAYGPASGRTLPVVSFLAFPAAETGESRPYEFPYHDGAYGRFANMLEPGVPPSFADPDVRYPLIVLAHGASAHGIYDVGHAQRLASHGYIVAVINYGDDRTTIPNDINLHAGFLRPLMTKAVIDSLLDSASFGAHIDSEAIGVSGHSFGGFTALAIAGGPFQSNAASVSDPRVKAGVLAAPWVGGHYDGADVYAFGDENRELANVDTPVLCAFGTADEATPASFILPAMRQLGGPTYVVELVDQPHIFEGGSWQDRDNWELLFFDAYLKEDAAALDTLKTLESMPGGNEDRQLFDYQK